METTVKAGKRWYVHHCAASFWHCKCDPMPRYEDAASTAADLGISLDKVEWQGSPYYGSNQERALRKYRAFVVANCGRAVLGDLKERPLSPAESQRAWATLRLDEATEAVENSEREREEHKASWGILHGAEETPRTRVRLVSQMERMDATTETCIFTSSIADSDYGGDEAAEKWTLVREVTIGIVQDKRETEVMIAVGENMLATMSYEEGSHRLLRCAGLVGLALGFLTVVHDISREVSYDSGTYLWVREFEEVRDILVWSIGIAAVTQFKADSAGAKIKPSGSSGWMPKEIFKATLALLPVREGFVDLREGGMQAAVRPVSYRFGPLLCPLCWDTGEPSRHSDSDFVQPRRLIGSSDGGEEYTAVSHLWSEFKGEDTVINMRRSAAIVGGPSSLWIDKLCINQNDNDEKATEISHMGSYYAGAHTTLICPAQQITAVPLVEPSRHLVAIPDQLNGYKGLNTWRQDGWHGRVWTFQEGYLSRNPRVVNSDTGTGLNGRWLDFMAYAATEDEPLRCEVGLPPYHRMGVHGDVYGTSRNYTTPFRRAWAACERHGWAPDLSLIRLPLGRLLQLTHERKCADERDQVIGVLGLAASAEQFRPGGLRDLDDAYREAVRCGALGAEVLLADIGGTSPNSCWIPKKGSEARHAPAMDTNCNALPVKVDESGRLVCEAYEVDMDMDARDRCKEWEQYHHQFSLQFNEGLFDAHVWFHGCTSTHGRVYMLAPRENKDALSDRVLIWASDNGDGTHHVHGTGTITYGHRYRTGQEPAAKPEDTTVTLTLGTSS